MTVSSAELIEAIENIKQEFARDRDRLRDRLIDIIADPVGGCDTLVAIHALALVLAALVEVHDDPKWARREARQLIKKFLADSEQ